MAYRCELCGKDVSFGNMYVKRGLAKAKGGNGRKVTGKTARKFRPNIQRVRVFENGSTTRKKVCTQCIRDGKVTKPPKMKYVLKELALAGKIKPQEKKSAS
ncbi:MAG: 50S ribosomal protein L28 [Planctomycetota bacterium]